MYYWATVLVVLEAALHTFRAAHSQRGMTASLDRKKDSLCVEVCICRELRFMALFAIGAYKFHAAAVTYKT